MTTKTYAGIGARKPPDEVKGLMAEVARRLDRIGYTLRSGAAEGADMAFESGATRKEIYLPWAHFNGHPSPYCKPAP